MRIEDSIVIEAPASTVWRVTEDIIGWPEWTPTIASVEKVGPGPISGGDEFLVRQPLQCSAIWTVTELEPGRRLVWERDWRGSVLRAAHAVASDGVKARSTLTLETNKAGARFLAPVLYLALLVENLALKRACERAWRSAAAIR